MKKKIKVKIIPIIITGTIFILLSAGFYNKLEVTNYTYSSNRIAKEFDGFRIVQISDLHCKNFGKNNIELIQKIIDLKPDLIVLTGDMIDGEHNNLHPVSDLLKGIYQVAPIYSVSGNHEFDSTAPYEGLMDLYTKYGVLNLDNSETIISMNGSCILVKGLSGNVNLYQQQKIMNQSTSDYFTILLYHYSNLFDIVSFYNYDLVLSGHVHGGIIRLPFIGGLLANDGSLFPKYDSGLFIKNNTTMISSRGLGDSVVPRFNNNPELVCITLLSEVN